VSGLRRSGGKGSGGGLDAQRERPELPLDREVLAFARLKPLQK
jgi:hypothetical protein